MENHYKTLYEDCKSMREDYKQMYEDYKQMYELQKTRADQYKTWYENEQNDRKRKRTKYNNLPVHNFLTSGIFEFSDLYATKLKEFEALYFAYCKANERQAHFYWEDFCDIVKEFGLHIVMCDKDLCIAGLQPKSEA